MKLATRPPRFLFPAALVVLLVSFGLSGFHAEDDPNDAYVYDRTESVLHLSLDAPAGTSLSAGGPAANIGIYVQRHSWEIWRQASTGLEEYRDANNAPESGASVNLSLSDGMGTLGDSTVITNADGFAYTTYSPDGGSGSVYVNAAVENSTASLFFDVTYTTTGYDESYSYSHTEATLVAELITNGSTDHVYSGETRELSLSVRYETWDVMTNSLGQSYTENHTSAPAEGAAVTWISESGDASVSGYGMVDAAGLCQGSLMMGSGNSVVRAEISYAAGQATSASLYFAAAPYYDPSGGDPSGGDPSGGDPSGGGSSSGDPSTEWSYSRSETIASISNLSAGGSTDMSTGETRHLTGEVRHEVWDVWVNGYGTEEWRYNYAGPAAWATVTAAIEFGDGSLGSTTVTSDGQGWFSLDYTMGSSSSRVTVSADGATSASGTNGSASVDFTYSSTTGQPDYGNGYDNGGTSSPSLLSYDGSYRIEGPHGDGPTYDLTPGTQRTVSGVLYWDSWEVWSDGSGNTTIENPQSYPAAWANLSLSLAQGDGTLADSSITTDSSGGFTTTFTMGNEASRVRIEATGGSSGTIAAELDFTPSPAGPVDDFVKVRDESSLFVSITGGSPQAGTETIPLEAQVTETTWEVWENGIAPAELRNYRTGPAIAASVEFSIASGSGNLTAIDSLTDADGTARASIIPGQADTVVAVNASFLTTGAFGQITVSPVPWVRQSIESSLLLSLQQMDNTVTATVRLQSWEIWLNPATGLGESRHESEGPAVNAEVIFQSLATSGYDASFYTPTVMTATDGTASTNYISLDATMAQVTANFAGQSVTETIHLPTASGSNGTDNGNWNGTDYNVNDGSGNTGSGNPVDGTNTTGNQNQNNQQTAPDVPMPAVALQGRTHRTQGGSGNFAGYYGGNDDTVNIETRYRSYRLALVRDIYGFEHDEVSIEPLDFIASEESFHIELEQKFAEGWRQANPEEQPQGLDPYEHIDVIIGSSGSYQDAYGSPFWAEGPTLPEFTKGQVANDIASDSVIRTFYENASTFFDPSTYWTGDVSPAAMGFPGGWTEDNRIAYGKAPHVGRPILRNHAKFLTGIVPEVQWSEYWLQAESAVPSGKEATYIMSLIATERDADGNLKVIEAGNVTFVIPAGEEVSEGLPEIEGFNEADSWLKAQADGTLLVRPPVKRGVERLLLPVEITDVYSNQIYDNECQSLPTPYYRCEPDNPMLVGPWDDEKVRLAVKVETAADDDLRAKIQVAVREVGTDDVSDSEPIAPDGEKTYLEFDAPSVRRKATTIPIWPVKPVVYEVVLGYDENDDGELSDSEVTLVFDKTPATDCHGAAYGGSTAYKDKIYAFSADAFEAAKTEVSSVASLSKLAGYGYAADLVSNFVGATTTAPEGATRTEGHAISPDQPKLSHRVGAYWGENCDATTHKFEFGPASTASDDIANSEAIFEIVIHGTFDNAVSLDVDFGEGESTKTSGWFSFQESVDFLDSDGYSERVFLAFGKCDLEGSFRIQYGPVSPDNPALEVKAYQVVGSLTDLYDFAIGSPEPGPTTALIQAGYASVASGDEGKVFYSEASFDSTDWISRATPFPHSKPLFYSWEDDSEDVCKTCP